MENPFSQIILGTAQLGMPYGLGKWKHDLMPEGEAFAILDAAWEQGITTLDTSPEYGVAEERIAKYLEENPDKSFHVISKIKTIPDDDRAVGASLQSWFKSCPFINLNNSASLTLMLHRETDIYRNAVIEGLTEMKAQAKLFCWGVSVYKETTARYAAETDSCFVVQLPFGVLNQAFGRNGVIELLSKQKKIVMARSVFSQGLLVSYGQNSIKLEEATIHLIDRLHALLTAQNFFINDFAVAVAMHEKGLNHLVLGADTADQLLSWKIHETSSETLNVPAEILKQLRELNSASLKPQKWKNVS